MRKKSNISNTGRSGLVTLLYVVSAVMAALFVYALYSSIMYIVNYAASYGVSVSDMMGDSIQYILLNSFSWLAYATIIFGITKCLGLLQGRGPKQTELTATKDYSSTEKSDEKPGKAENSSNESQSAEDSVEEMNGKEPTKEGADKQDATKENTKEEDQK
ncbi:MAG: hypothetical protein GX663_04540 [Clostridiales bacterium]|nr:hypothetical protein [Clostridiales bacterium]